MISAIILAKNEETSIADAIESVSFCSEVIVIDNDSTDKTGSIAKKSGAVVKHVSSSDFSYLRNEAMKYAKHDWLLYIDADERVSDKLAKEVVKAVKESHFTAYALRREDVFWNTKLHHGETRQAYTKGIVRLVKKGSGTWKGKVHETFVTDKSVGKLKNVLTHHSHSGVSDFLDDVNNYSTLRAQELFDTGRKTNFLDIFFTPLGKFVYTFFILQGFRDGPPGFVYSFMMSFHSFLVRSKVYLLWHKK